MADNDPKEKLLSQKESEKKVETVIPFLLLLVTSSGMCFAGLGNVSVKFATVGVLYSLIWLAVFALTYWQNSIQLVTACHKKSAYSHSRLIYELFNREQGRKRGLTVQILMVVNNIIILTYLQERIAANAFKVFNQPKNERIEEQTATDVFFYVASANIALILLALQNKYERVKNFAVVSILVWIYLFVGVVAEAWNNVGGSGNIQRDDLVATLFPQDYAYFTSIGIIALFTGYHQIVPYVFGNVKDLNGMKKTLSFNLIASVIFVFSVALYFVLYHNQNLNILRYSGLTIIASCVAIINVLPTRELIVQILDDKAKEKSNTRDRIITVLLLSVTLLLSIGFNKFEFLQVALGLSVLLTSGLGFIFPGWVAYKVAEGDEKKKATILLAWNVVLGLVVFASGVFVFLENDHTEELANFS